MINQKKINAYMDLVNVIVKKAGDKWIIDTADSGPDPFNSDEELMEYINYELREIEATYTANGELDDLLEIYRENGLELPGEEYAAAMYAGKEIVVIADDPRYSSSVWWADGGQAYTWSRYLGLFERPESIEAAAAKLKTLEEDSTLYIRAMYA